MNCQEITSSASYRCAPVNDSILFVEAPFCLAFDGGRIGAYIQDIGRGKVRISDNSSILFTALTHGIKQTPSRAKKYIEIAQNYGLTLSDDGELFIACEQRDAGFFLARYIEAASEISILCKGQKPASTSNFEKIVAEGLTLYYTNRVRRDYQVFGASGHQLGFPFVIDHDKAVPTYIQTITSPEGHPNWTAVYNTLGKMTDLQNAAQNTHRVAIVEMGDAHEMQQVASALANAADVLIYERQDQLQRLAMVA